MLHNMFSSKEQWEAESKIQNWNIDFGQPEAFAADEVKTYILPYMAVSSNKWEELFSVVFKARDCISVSISGPLPRCVNRAQAQALI